MHPVRFEARNYRSRVPLFTSEQRKTHNDRIDQPLPVHIHEPNEKGKHSMSFS